ncbi:MAG: hypothetical protein JOZ72_18425 [Alphaproteobacteria bacterium]|nr:hypothetical protein [Alphaproteobacteria bacterium]
MRFETAFAALLVLAVTPALADDPMAGYYGNTIVSTGGLGEVHSHYRPDHSFDMVGSAFGITRTYKGTWAEDGKGNICRTFAGDVPPNTANPLCTPLPLHKVGDSWTLKTPDGSTRALTLKAGIQ